MLVATIARTHHKIPIWDYRGRRFRNVTCASYTRPRIRSGAFRPTVVDPDALFHVEKRPLGDGSQVQNLIPLDPGHPSQVE